MTWSSLCTYAGNGWVTFVCFLVLAGPRILAGEAPDPLNALYVAAQAGNQKQWDAFLMKAIPAVKMGDSAGELAALRVFEILQRVPSPEARATQEQLLVGLEKGTTYSSRVPVLRARLRIAQGKGESALRALDEILKKNPSPTIAAEASFAYADELASRGKYDEAKAALDTSSQFWRSIDYKADYNGLLSDAGYQHLYAKIRDLDASDRAVADAFNAGELHRIHGDWAAAAERYTWVSAKAPQGAYGIPALWRAYQCTALGTNDKAPAPAMDAYSAAEIAPHSSLIALVSGEVALLARYDLSTADSIFRNHLLALKVISISKNKASPIDVAHVTAADGTRVGPFLPALLDRYALCRMVARDFATAEALLSQELSIRPPGRHAEGFNAADELLTMCHEKRLPVIQADVVMRGDQRTQLLLFFGAYQMYAGSHAESKRSFSLVLSDKKAKPDGDQQVYAQYELAELMRLEEKGDDALKAWDAIAAKYPTSFYAPYCLVDAAKLCAAKGDKLGAVKRLETVALQYPTSSIGNTALYNLGFVYYLTDDFDQARTAFMLLCKRYPTSWEAKRVADNELKTMPPSTGK